MQISNRWPKLQLESIPLFLFSILDDYVNQTIYLFVNLNSMFHFSILSQKRVMGVECLMPGVPFHSHSDRTFHS